MKKKIFKVVSLLITLCLTFTALYACGNEEAETNGSSAGGSTTIASDSSEDRASESFSHSVDLPDIGDQSAEEPDSSDSGDQSAEDPVSSDSGTQSATESDSDSASSSADDSSQQGPQEPLKPADVFIFMGQSNMAGRGNAPESITVTDGAAYEYRSVTGNDDDGWFYKLEEPFGQNENNEKLSDGETGDGKKTGGPVASFAEAYYRETGVTVVGISASVGNTSIYSWVPGKDYYEESARRLRACVEQLEKEGVYEVRHINMVWCQGSNDATNVANGKLNYEEKLVSIVNGLRNNGKGSIENCFIIALSDNTENKYALSDLQMRICETNEHIYLGSLKYRSVSDDLRDGAHYRQGVYNVVGVDTGKHAAQILYGKEVDKYERYIYGEEKLIAEEYGATLIYYSPDKDDQSDPVDPIEIELPKIPLN